MNIEVLFEKTKHTDNIATRNGAFNAFVKSGGLPNKKQEAWKYTSLNALEKQNFTLPKNTQTAHALKNIAWDIPASRQVFVDGYYQPALSDNLPDGVEIKRICEHTIQTLDAQGFHALNTAMLQDGLILSVAENIKISQPIHIIMHTQTNDVSMHTRNQIIVGRHSQVCVLESFVGEASGYFSNHITQIHTDENARCEYIKIQAESLTAFYIADTQITQSADSEVCAHSYNFGAQLARSDVNAGLQGQGASLKLYGLYLPKNKQHVDHHTCIEHPVPYCNSEQYYKGIIDNKARAVFNGTVKVAKDAQKINSSQYNKNLLLASTAEVDTKPQLEIYADDVKCAHGATVGQLDNDALFYLQSRGLPVAEAKELLVSAFAKEILAFLPIKALQEKLAEFIHQQNT